MALMSIGERIKARRLELDFSQTALASAVGVTRNAVSNWELGKNEPSSAMVRLVADKLGVTVEWLAYGSAPRPPALEDSGGPYKPPSNSPLAQLILDENQYFYQFGSDAVEEAGYKRGDIAIMDCSPKIVTAVRSGDIVVARINGETELAQARTVERQFVAPRMLVTNRTRASINAQPLTAMEDAFVTGLIVSPPLHRDLNRPSPQRAADMGAKDPERSKPAMPPPAE